MKTRGLEKATLVVFGSAFVLSLFIGLVSKKPFGIALGRSLISSILFGAIFTGGLLLLRRYIPDLGSLINPDREKEEPEAQGEDTGRVVDYTVGEGAPEGFRDAEAYAETGFPAPGGSESGVDFGDLGRLSPAADLGGRGEPSSRSGFEQGPGTVPLSPAGRAKPAAAAGPGAGERSAGQEGGESIDEALPSLDALFESEEGATSSADAKAPEIMHDNGKRTGGKGNYINIRDARIPNEPDVLAKAIKRVMNQD